MSRHALQSQTMVGNVKKYVFKCFVNCLASLMSCNAGGKAFHARGPAYEKARSPMLLRHLGFRYMALSAERSPGRDGLTEEASEAVVVLASRGLASSDQGSVGR